MNIVHLVETFYILVAHGEKLTNIMHIHEFPFPPLMSMVLSWGKEKHMCLRVVILFTSISGAPGQMEYRGYLGASL